MDQNMEEMLLSQYDKVAAASARMLHAARAGDWDRLIAAETECAALVERLRAAGNPETMSSSGRKRRFSAIHRILADDAEIRRLTQPWLQQLEGFLGCRDDERRLRKAYR
jgi:flagellar protein FliT